MSSKKYCYFFSQGKADGNAGMKNLLGGKGANMAEMCNLNVPVPPGFTISTEACVYYFKNNSTWPPGLKKEIAENLKRLEKLMGATFGSKKEPLLLSVRSGARASMPGMMDTVLNLGLNEETLLPLINLSGNERFAYDSYRRFIQMFSDVVLNVEHASFEKELQKIKTKKKVKLDTDLTAKDLKDLAGNYLKLTEKTTGNSFPINPKKQLEMSIEAVFGSWNNQRAHDYRDLYGIPEDWGTAVNIQVMVFGNMGESSGTGVAFTRDPATGNNRFFGEFLVNAQGEDVVAGIRTPVNVEGMGKHFPQAAKELLQISKNLETHYTDMLDLEFTVQNNELYMLQARVGKRTAASAVKIAVDMVQEKLITKKEAVQRILPVQLDQLLHKTIDPKAKVEVIAKGLPASPGAAVGKVVFCSEDARKLKEKEEPAILVRYETSPEDLAGMAASVGILTVHGGMTSHAAVVARGMGKCCISGASEMKISERSKLLTIGKVAIHEGDWITLDGSTGRVIVGKTNLVTPSLSGEFATLMKWSDSFRKLDVRANADTPKDAALARKFGAQGIGLCRTEHMFFAADRILAVREMILSSDKKERTKSLKKLLPMQKKDFSGILKSMDGLPVTIRLLDPPLHEFLPKTRKAIETVAHDMGIHMEDIQKRIESLAESNPMLGHRGCRLGITFMDIYEMQVEAICLATAELLKKGFDPKPEIMIPLVCTSEELRLCREMAERIIEKIASKYKIKLNPPIGTMIELPRAAIVADTLAKNADFFSFGTNDLTQTALGLSRDDSGTFLPTYVEKQIFQNDPFISIDEEGVGEIMKIGIAKGRKTKPKLKIGICGEHGGDPKSVAFCHSLGLNYVSCSPYRIPLARLAAAQAAIKK